MAPTILWQLNSNTEISPAWVTIGATQYFYFSGPDTTSSALDSIDPPTTVNYNWAPELWVANSPYANGTQCVAYNHPSVGSPAANMIRITFQNEATATAPKLTAWNDSTRTAITNEILTGTAQTGTTSWLKAADTTAGAPSTGWAINSTAASNPTTINALQGDNYYVTCATAAASNGTKTFALACAIPSDATAGGTGHSWVYTLKYSYA